jgi:hypothetical protein
VARSNCGCGLYAGKEADAGYTLRPQQIIQHVVPSLIDIGINQMRRQVPSSRCEPYAYVAAYLPDPNRGALKANVRRPQAQVKSLVEAQASALKRQILLTPRKVQGAYRRVAVS